MQSPVVTTVLKQDKQTLIIKVTAAGNVVTDPTYAINFNGNYNIRFVGSQLIYNGDVGGTHQIEIRSPLLQCNGGNQRYPVIIAPSTSNPARVVSDVQFAKFMDFQTYLTGQLQLQLYNTTDSRPLNSGDDNFNYGYLYFVIEKII